MSAAPRVQTKAHSDRDFLATKIAVYCHEVARQEHLQEHMPGLASYARELASLGDKSALNALSKEVDVWLREAHAAPVALAVVAAMQTSGIPRTYLPVLPSARRLRSIAERGEIRTSNEASLVRTVLENPELVRLLDGQASLLGAALGRWQSMRR